MIRAAAAALLFFALFAVLVSGLTPLLTRMPPQFYLSLCDLREKGRVETALIGDSLCEYMIDPRPVEQRTGRSTFNLSVHGGRAESFQAFAEEMAARGARQIVIFYDPNDAYTLPDAEGDVGCVENPYVEMTVNNFLTSPLRRLCYLFRASRRYGRFLDRAFPWRFYGFMRPEDARLNLAMRLFTVEARREAMRAIEEDEHLTYMADGFVERHLPTDWQYRETDEQIAVRGAESVRLSEWKKKSFRSIRDLCRRRGCDLLVLQTPWHPRRQRLDEWYQESTRQMEAFCGESGIEYYDLALLKRSFLPWLDEYYYDYEHFSEEGAQIFSRALGEFLAMRGEGKDVSGLFVTREEHMRELELAAMPDGRKEGVR